VFLIGRLRVHCLSTRNSRSLDPFRIRWSWYVFSSSRFLPFPVTSDLFRYFVAHSLNGALIVNPWNTAETGEAIHKALTMNAEQKEDAHLKLFRYVSQYTASHWVRSPLSLQLH